MAQVRVPSPTSQSEQHEWSTVTNPKWLAQVIFKLIVRFGPTSHIRVDIQLSTSQITR